MAALTAARIFARIDRAALIGQTDRGVERRGIDTGELRPAQRDRAAAMEGAHDALRAQSLALALKLRRQHAVDRRIAVGARRCGVRVGKLDMALRGESLRIVPEGKPAAQTPAREFSVEVASTRFPAAAKLRDAFDLARNQRRRQRGAVEFKVH